MTKKEFIKLINDNKSIFINLTLNDATLRTHYPHTTLVVNWKGYRRSVIKTMRGSQTDSKNIDILNKYKSWLSAGLEE